LRLPKPHPLPQDAAITRRKPNDQLVMAGMGRFLPLTDWLNERPFQGSRPEPANDRDGRKAKMSRADCGGNGARARARHPLMRKIRPCLRRKLGGY
jgi:hypothetical protein